MGRHANPHGTVTMDDAIHDESTPAPARDEGRPDPARDEAASAAAGHAGLVAQLRQLEDFAARTVAEGDALPPQATEMILHLREIVDALDGLTASMAEPLPADASPRPGVALDDHRGTT
jgi:hypothetical protein